MPTMRADDVVYASRLDELGYLGASIEHYKTWSSRIIIELFLMFFLNIYAMEIIKFYDYVRNCSITLQVC